MREQHGLLCRPESRRILDIASDDVASLRTASKCQSVRSSRVDESKREPNTCDLEITDLVKSFSSD